MKQAICHFIAIFVAMPAAAQVTVHKSEALIEHRTFDPKNPPADMPPLHGREAAVTQTTFGSEARVGGEVISDSPRADQSEATVRIDQIDLTVSLRVTVWLPKKADKKLIAHEEGHRQISEYFYKDAESIAQKAAQAYLSKEVSARGADAQAAASAALQRAAQEIGGKYLGQTDQPCGKAQQEFDRLTAHGTNDAKESAAVKRAIGD